MARKRDSYYLTDVTQGDTEFMRRPVADLNCPMCGEPMAFDHRYLAVDWYRCPKHGKGFYVDARWKPSLIDGVEHRRIGRDYYGRRVLCSCRGLNFNGGCGQNGAGVRWVMHSVDHAWHQHSGVKDKDCCSCR